MHLVLLNEVHVDRLMETYNCKVGIYSLSKIMLLWKLIPSWLWNFSTFKVDLQTLSTLVPLVLHNYIFSGLSPDKISVD